MLHGSFNTFIFSFIFSKSSVCVICTFSPLILRLYVWWPVHVRFRPFLWHKNTPHKLGTLHWDSSTSIPVPAPPEPERPRLNVTSSGSHAPRKRLNSDVVREGDYEIYVSYRSKSIIYCVLSHKYVTCFHSSGGRIVLERMRERVKVCVESEKSFFIYIE